MLVLLVFAVLVFVVLVGDHGDVVDVAVVRQEDFSTLPHAVLGLILPPAYR